MPFFRPSPFGPEPSRSGNLQRDRLIAGVLLGLLLIARLTDFAPVTLMRLWAFDVTLQARPAADVQARVAVVDIDDASLLSVGQWPWPRDVLADLVDGIARAGASVIALDILLAEPDRMSPSVHAAAGGSNGGSNDARLADAMRRAPVVVGAALSAVPLPAGDAAPPIGRVAVRGTLDLTGLTAAPSLVRPLEAFEAAGSGVGLVNLYPDADASVRNAPALASSGGTILPGIALEAARVASGASGLVVDAAGMAGPAGVWLADRFVPTDMRGRIRVDTRDPSRVPVVPAHRLLAGAVDPVAFDGRVVVVGASASGLNGTVRTTGGVGMPHALFQALAIDTILGGRTVERPSFLVTAEIAVAAAIGAGLLVVCPWLGLAGLGRAAAALTLALPAAAVVACAAGALVDASLPLFAGLSVVAVSAVSRLHQQGAVRREQAAMLARQDAYMRQVVDASFDAIVTVDAVGRVATANARASRMFGVPPAALVGASVGDFLEGDWAQSLRNAPERALRDAVESHRVVLASAGRGGGALVPAELTVAETATEDRAFVIVLRDISARLEAEAAARRAAERLRDGIARITEGFALFGPDRRLVICNDRFVAMLGEAGGAAREQAAFEAIMERYAEASCAPTDAVGRTADWLAERTAAFRQAAEPRVQETLDGRWFRIDERATAEGGLVGVYTDITELKLHEIEMADAMRRAEAASSAKSEFLANMSHELRTPLNAVIGFADLMKREMLGPLGNDQYRTYVGDIIDSGTKLLGMIEVILEFSRSEQTSLVDTETPTAPNEVARAVLRDLGPAAGERRIEMSATLGDDVPAVTIGSAVLYQILQNLVSNAIKFSPPDGAVSVATFVAPDGRPTLQVSDRGIGIPPELIDKVTQPFWQRQGPLVRSHSGVGLGLAIVKSHIDALGGELRFVSRVDEGTTATVLLPVSRVDRAS